MVGMRIARVYDDPGPEDGVRVLVDRLWPRGMRKDDLRVGEWRPDIAPSTSLRQWYAHRPEVFEEFAARYEDELADHGDALDEIRSWMRKGQVTLVTATRDLEHSQAAVLATLLSERFRSG